MIKHITTPHSGNNNNISNNYNEYPIAYEAHLASKCIMPTFLVGNFDPPKVGQSDLVFGVLSRFISSSVYKSLCAAVMICSTLVNIQTQRQTDRQHFDQLT